MSAAATFAAVGVTLYAAHQLADHVFGQTDRQAKDKADVEAAWRGWGANLSHVGAYHAVMAVMLVVAWLLLDLDLSPWGVGVGLAFSAVTHAVLDRRWPVLWIARHTGSPAFVAPGHPLPGAYLIDQSLHHGCLWAAALLMVTVG